MRVRRPELPPSIEKLTGETEASTVTRAGNARLMRFDKGEQGFREESTDLGSVTEVGSPRALALDGEGHLVLMGITGEQGPSIRASSSNDIFLLKFDRELNPL